MSNFTPWTQEQAEEWCKPDRHPRFGDIYDLGARDLYRAAYRDGWRAAFAKAAEMIEACETVYQIGTEEWRPLPSQYDKRKAKLVCPQPIGEE